MKKVLFTFGILLTVLCYGQSVILNTQAQVNAYGPTAPAVVTGTIWIDGNSIVDLSPLNNIQNTTGGVVIQNTSLTSLNGLNNLAGVGGSMVIAHNQFLNNLYDLNSLATIGINFLVFDNLNLIDFLGPHGIVSQIGNDLDVYNNAVLEKVSGLDNLNDLPGDYRVAYCPKVTSLSIGNNATIGGDFEISSPVLSSLFPNGGTISSIGGNFKIFGGQLTNLIGLDYLETVNGNFEITNVTLLENLLELGHLMNISGALTLIGNTEMTSFQGLENIQRVTNLNIIGLTSVSNFSGLENLEEITGDFTLQLTGITDLYGLSALANIGGNITITSNSNLTLCAILPVCFNSNNGIGTITIFGNNPTCDSLAGC